MKSKLVCVALTCLVLGQPLCAAQSNTLSPAEKSAGWKLLFDGKSLAGWRGYKTEQPVGWSVRDGTLVHAAGRSGDIVTAQEYQDFELSLEWNIAEGGNSGIIYRAALGEASAARSGVEYQLLDNAKAKDNKVGSHHAGAIYDLVAPYKDVTKGAGKWNEARIRVQNWKIEHWLNGVKVAEADLASPAGKALIQGSKFKDWKTFAAHRRGHVVLQDHGDAVSFRNVKIREL